MSGQSFDIENILIDNNTMVDCGGPSASGGVYLAQTTGNGSQHFNNITISNNIFQDVLLV